MSNTVRTEPTQDPVWRSIRGLRKMLAKNRRSSLSKFNDENEGVVRTSISFTCEEENRANFLKSDVSPHFSKPTSLNNNNSVCLALKENINKSNFNVISNNEKMIFLQKENENLVKENFSLKENLKELQSLLNRTRKDNLKQISMIQNDFQIQMNTQKEEFEYILDNMKNEFEKNLQSKEEEINIMSSLLNNTCETEPNNIISSNNHEESMIFKYEEIIQNLKSEFTNEISRMNQEYKHKIHTLSQEKMLAVKEIDFLKKEIYEIKYNSVPQGTIKCQSQRTDCSKNRLNTNDSRLFNETREKVKSTLLSKVNQFEEDEEIENEITPNNKKELYEKISARIVEKKSENTLPDRNVNKTSIISEEGGRITDADIFFMNNSIRHLSIKKKKQGKY